MASLSLTLPTGRVVRVRTTKGAPIASDVVDGRRLFAGRALAALLEGRVVVEERGARLDRDALLELALRDFHALREVAIRAGVVAAEPDELVCRNCDEPFVLDPARLELDELAERFERDETPLERDVELPRPLRLSKGRRAASVTMRATTVRTSMPLWAALERPGGLSVTASLVRALGVARAGPESDPRALARALERCPDDVWRAVERGFLSLAYADDAFVPFVCPRCGTLHEVDAPLLRELDAEDGDERGRSHTPEAGDSFPDERAFEALVERVAPEVYAARGVANVAIRVETGVPHVDTSGEPLLGSYEPGVEGDAAALGGSAFLVTLYFRTFRKMWDEDGPYDLEAEVRETIDHELEHHLYHLAGHDPMDDEERREAREDLERVYGKRTLRRAEARAFAWDVAAFAKATWWIWALLAAALGVAWLSGALR